MWRRYSINKARIAAGGVNRNQVAMVPSCPVSGTGVFSLCVDVAAPVAGALSDAESAEVNCK